ncbi:host cell division inhibitor Icd-like protein [Lonepinella sp. BR2882]|uniref:host cell division inhibitor Icd-like protein n=1 Tax=Lonepinella sp. BR2882 TaxID=3095283 RepID=UPI003F6DDA75
MPKIKVYARFNMKLNHSHNNKDENNSQYIFLTKCGEICDSFHALAKSSAEPRNSNVLLMANDSTPIYNRAFFVRSIRTPKIKVCPNLDTPEESNQTNFGLVSTLSNEVNKLNFELVTFLSMVACNGKGFALCCVPLVAVFEPVTRYRPKASKLKAVAFIKFLLMDLTAMFTYIFIAIKRTDLTNQFHKIRIQAESEQQARKLLAKTYILFFAGRINPTHKRSHMGVSYA